MAVSSFDWKAELQSAKERRTQRSNSVITESRGEYEAYLIRRDDWIEKSSRNFRKHPKKENGPPKKIYAGIHIRYGTILECGCRLVPGMKISNRMCLRHYKTFWYHKKLGHPPKWKRWTGPYLCGHNNRRYGANGYCRSCYNTKRFRQRNPIKRPHWTGPLFCGHSKKHRSYGLCRECFRGDRSKLRSAWEAYTKRYVCPSSASSSNP